MPEAKTMPPPPPPLTRTVAVAAGGGDGGDMRAVGRNEGGQQAEDGICVRAEVVTKMSDGIFLTKKNMKSHRNSNI